MVWFWLGLTIALTVLEATTTQFVSIWFAAGSAVCTIVCAIFPSIGLGWQILIFVLCSLALLIATRPLVKRLLSRKTAEQATNLDRLIGKRAVVTEQIDNLRAVGAVKINGLVWSARSANDEVIPVGEIVVFERINGNKAIVSTADAKGD